MEIDKFNSEFTTLYEEIVNQLNLIKSNECETAETVLDESMLKFDNLKEKLDLNGAHLPQYVRRTSQERINQLSQLMNEARNVIKPKKVFKFNTRKQVKTTIKSDQLYVSTVSNEDLNDLKKQQKSKDVLDALFCGLKERSKESLIMHSSEVNSRDIQLIDLDECVVNVYGNPSTVHIINCKNSQISIGPVSTSVFIDNSTNCIYQLFCQQLRVHNTYDCTFKLHVCTRGIIEDSSRLKFTNYQFNYDQLDNDIERSKLDRTINNWDKIEDFNWLVNNKHSPNWQTF